VKENYPMIVIFLALARSNLHWRRIGAQIGVHHNSQQTKRASNRSPVSVNQSLS
jgi:hypothetical protein